MEHEKELAAVTTELRAVMIAAAALPAETDEQVQPYLFDIEQPWEKVWKGMPEFVQEDLEPWRSIIVHFASPGDLIAFSRLVERKLTPQTRSTWFPPVDAENFLNKRYADEA